DGVETKFAHPFKKQLTVGEYFFRKIIIVNMCLASKVVKIAAHFHIAAVERFQRNINRSALVVHGAISKWIANIGGSGNFCPHFFLYAQRAVTIVYFYAVALFAEKLVGI